MSGFSGTADSAGREHRQDLGGCRSTGQSVPHKASPATEDQPASSGRLCYKRKAKRRRGQSQALHCQVDPPARAAAMRQRKAKRRRGQSQALHCQVDPPARAAAMRRKRGEAAARAVPGNSLPGQSPARAAQGWSPLV